MDQVRKAFELKYQELHPSDKSTLMPNGNYSGWVKQAHWDAFKNDRNFTFVDLKFK